MKSLPRCCCAAQPVVYGATQPVIRDRGDGNGSPGLIGTVQGMIMAFMVTSTTTSTGVAKAQELAQGIYTALVTTFSGLCVAVVAVLLGSYLEGRIDNLLHKMEDVFVELLHAFERFEGKIRVARTPARGDGKQPSDAGVAIEKSSVGLHVVPRKPSRTEPPRKVTAGEAGGSSRGSAAAAPDEAPPGGDADPASPDLLEEARPPKSLWATMRKDNPVAAQPSGE